MRYLRAAGSVWLCVLLTACAGSLDRSPLPWTAWDAIVTPALIAPGADIEREVTPEADARIYALYPAADAAGYSLAVAVSRGGSRLPEAEWRAALEGTTPDRRARFFPPIGARARVAEPRFSPDGALTGLTFTTRDGDFDVVVSLLEGGGGIHPDFTAADVARRIEAAYESRRR